MPLTTRVTETFGQYFSRGYLLLMKPDQPLAPAARYRVQVTRPYSAPTVIREFQTAADAVAERTPPAPEVRLASAAAIECSDSTTPIRCCSAYPALALVGLDFEVGGDTRRDDLYDIRLEVPGGGSMLLRAGVAAPISGVVACSQLPETDDRNGRTSQPFVVLGGPRTLSFVARSITGQESPPTLLQLDDHCAGGPIADGGVAADSSGATDVPGGQAGDGSDRGDGGAVGADRSIDDPLPHGSDAGSSGVPAVVGHGGCVMVPAAAGAAPGRPASDLLALGLLLVAIVLRGRSARPRSTRSR